VAFVLSRSDAEALLAHDEPIVRRVDRVAAKRMHLSDIMLAAPDLYGMSGIANNPLWVDQGSRLIWVVVISGGYVLDVPGLPGGASLPHHGWAIMVVAADDSLGPAIAGVHADPNGTWPPFFDALPDNGPP
jgi:hypothetical protein